MRSKKPDHIKLANGDTIHLLSYEDMKAKSDGTESKFEGVAWSGSMWMDIDGMWLLSHLGEDRDEEP